jgi:probable phosphoglycerate mutase
MDSTATHTLWLIRHGETEWSASGRHTGRSDIALTAQGQHQAVTLGRHLGGRRFAQVLTSPLARAADTCRLAGYGGVARSTDDLREWDYGIYEGRTTADIRTEIPGWTVWSGDIPEGESAEQVGARARRVIAQARAAPGDVALFAHAHVLRILTACYLGLPPRDGRCFALGTASISILGYEHETPALITWNQDWHLVREESP